jgi:hypothetical protein
MDDKKVKVKSQEIDNIIYQILLFLKNKGDIYEWLYDDSGIDVTKNTEKEWLIYPMIYKRGSYLIYELEVKVIFSETNILINGSKINNIYTTDSFFLSRGYNKTKINE